jgi:hypothetical protein
MGIYRNVLKQSRLILSQRTGKGPWMVWFPANKPKYISHSIKTKGDLQALGSWLASETEGRDWHNSVFKDYKDVSYKGRVYTKEQGKLLYRALVKNNDWESVDLGNPVKVEKAKLPSPIREKTEQMSLELE